MYYIGVYLFTLVTSNILCSSKGAKCSITLDVSTCYTTERTNVTKVKCRDTNVCKKRFYISYVKLEPYSPEIVTDLLRTCCGECINVTEVNVLTKISQITPSIMNTSHFVFPVLGRSNILTLYGYQFIPLIQIPNIYYITNKPEDLMYQLITSCFNMWPLTIICFLLVTISGFIGWLLDTWVNKQQFPRHFFIGWFEGFWWSYISMTTVGYGDKIPKSVAARLFSIVWIFVGIAIFSLVTALLTSEITKANSLPSPTMIGTKVGAFRHRLYESIVVAKYGGVLIDIEPVNATEGIRQLISKLKRKEIDGFVLDKYMLLMYNYHFKNSSKYKDAVDFLKKKTIQTEIVYTGGQFSYGILVKDLDDYQFLVDFVIDNREVLNTCNNLLINSYSKRESVDKVINPLFSSSSGIFWQSFINICITIIIICCFGILYEFQRGNTRCGKRVFTLIK